MERIIKETVTTENSGHTVVAEPVVTQPVVQEPVVVTPKRIASETQTLVNLIYFLFGLLEILLVFRFFLRLTGAGTGSIFVTTIYSLTSIFVLPFEGIFRRAVTDGAINAAVFEPSTIIAILVYAVIAWAIVQLVKIMSRRQDV